MNKEIWEKKQLTTFGVPLKPPIPCSIKTGISCVISFEAISKRLISVYQNLDLFMNSVWLPCEQIWLTPFDGQRKENCTEFSKSTKFNRNPKGWSKVAKVTGCITDHCPFPFYRPCELPKLILNLEHFFWMIERSNWHWQIWREWRIWNQIMILLFYLFYKITFIDLLNSFL